MLPNVVDLLGALSGQRRDLPAPRLVRLVELIERPRAERGEVGEPPLVPWEPSGGAVGRARSKVDEEGLAGLYERPGRGRKRQRDETEALAVVETLLTPPG